VHPCWGKKTASSESDQHHKRLSSSTNAQDTLLELRFQQVSNSSISFKLSERPFQWNSAAVELHFIVEQT